jgi:hypothetical protein
MAFMGFVKAIKPIQKLPLAQWVLRVIVPRHAVAGHKTQKPILKTPKKHREPKPKPIEN